MNKYLVTLIAVGALSLAPVSHAQLGGLLGGKKSEASADLGAQQDQLVRGYVGAGKDVLSSNGLMAEALGIKAEGVNAAATADALSANEIQGQDKAISANSAAISEQIKSGAKLKDAEAKAKYAKGLVALASGVKKYIDMRKDAQGFASGLSSASPLQIGKLQAGAYIAKNLPTSVSNLTSVLRSAVDFAKSNGVEVPKDATSLL